MGYFADVFCLPGGAYTPKERSRLGNFILLQGILYAITGLSLSAAPSLWTQLHLVNDLSSDKAGEGWQRAVGGALHYIGMLYVASGLGDSHHFALTSTFTRPALVPIVLCGFAGLGYLPWPFAIFFSVVDAILSEVTFRVHRGQEQGQGYFADVFCLPGGAYTPKQRSRLGKFILLQGILYAITGLSLSAAPSLWTQLHLVNDLSSDKAAEGWQRVVGFLVTYIGVIYVFGGLADNHHFALVGTFTRSVLAPIAFCGAAALRYLPWPFAIFFSVVDFVLAAVTFMVHQGQQGRQEEAKTD